MERKLTIVAYHFVRDPDGSRHPGIKARTVEAFKGQLDYIRRHYTVIRMEDLIRAVRHRDEFLPPKSLLLTFDDGYRDHFTHVFPILHDAGVQGSFFPCARAVTERVVLDVNKIHFILAAAQDHSMIIPSIFSALDEFRPQYGLRENREYYEELALPGRFDTGEVIFIKRLLQRALPEDLRGTITDRLFRRYVSAAERDFADELYMSMDELRCMREAGMFIGSHAYDHRWMDTLAPDEQRRDIGLSLDMLRSIGVAGHELVMCYPYGAYNDSLLDILRAEGFACGLSAEPGTADLDEDDPLALKRLDTNDLPVSGRALQGGLPGTAPEAARWAP